MTNPYSHSEAPKSKRKLGSKTIGWILIALAILMVIGGAGILPKILFAIAFGLPGLWLLLHARRESAGAPPMKKHWGIIIPIAVAALFGGTMATPLPEDGGAETTGTPSTTASSPAPTTTPSSSSTRATTSSAKPEATTATTTATPALPPETTTTHAAPTTQETAEAVMGFTEAPGQAAPTPMGKVIESCGDVNIHERGTTFFTDGTSGWTQECADKMVPPAPAQQFFAPPAQEQPAAGGATSGTCKEIGHKTYAGDGVYVPDHDKDGDGVGCESYPG